MAKSTQLFTPDWVSPPGDTILDLLEERNWTPVQLAKHLGYGSEYISQLIGGKAPITENIALRLENVLGSTAKFWLQREIQYRSQLEKINQEECLQSWVPWLDQFPVRELMKQRVIPEKRLIKKNKPAVVKDLLHFFDVASPSKWNSRYAEMKYSFRRTREQQSDIGAISAWIRQGEILAEENQGSYYSESKFKQAIYEIKYLTELPPKNAWCIMQNLCRDSGVILLFIPSLPRLHISGMTRWLSPDTPVIQLSFYGKQNDRFWFTFFHEVAHILLHDKQRIFVDDWGNETEKNPEIKEQENEADVWSREFLISPNHNRELSSLKSKSAVIEFAKRIEIHPGIVVGRLQHDGLIRKDWMNDLKENFCLED